MGNKKIKLVDNDTSVVSRDQYNEVGNVRRDSSSEDSIDLKSPGVTGEESMSGEAPDPESDDDTLEAAHAVGQQLGEDLEHPQEVDIARDIDTAEKHHRED